MLDVTHMQVSLAGATDFVDAYQRGRPADDRRAVGVSRDAAPCLPGGAGAVVLANCCRNSTRLSSRLPRLTRQESLDPPRGVSRAISALMAVSNTSWKTFFEQVSRVEANPALTIPPASIRSWISTTRDRYRKAIEGDRRRCAGVGVGGRGKGPGTDAVPMPAKGVAGMSDAG